MRIGKIVVGIVLACLTAPLFAAFQYGTISAANADYGSSAFSAFADRGGAFGLQNAFYFNTDAYLLLSFSKGNPSFGAYYLDGRALGDGITLESIGDGLYTAVDASGNTVKFNAGDSIGFWAKDVNNRIVYDTPGIDGQHTYNGTSIRNGNDYVVAFGNYGQYVNSPHGNFTFEDMVASAQSVLNVQVSSEAPSGQPLPGVLASLFAGAAAYAGCRARRRKSQEK